MNNPVTILRCPMRVALDSDRPRLLRGTRRLMRVNPTRGSAADQRGVVIHHRYECCVGPGQRWTMNAEFFCLRGGQGVR